MQFSIRCDKQTSHMHNPHGRPTQPVSSGSFRCRPRRRNVEGAYKNDGECGGDGEKRSASLVRPPALRASRNSVARPLHFESGVARWIIRSPFCVHERSGEVFQPYPTLRTCSCCGCVQRHHTGDSADIVSSFADVTTCQRRLDLGLRASPCLDARPPGLSAVWRLASHLFYA